MWVGARRVEAEISKEYVDWCELGELNGLDVLRWVGESRLRDFWELEVPGSSGVKTFGDGGN